MPLTSTKVLELARVGLDSTGIKGRLDGLAMQVGNTSTERHLLNRIKAQLPQSQKVPQHLNPFHGSAALRKEAPFSASDVEWLRRLPTDPAQISDDDVKGLRQLESQAVAGTGDARLIRSIIEPVRRHHEQLTARSTIAGLRAKTPSSVVPDELVRLMAITISAEVPNLTEQEAAARAMQALREAHAQRVAEHARAVAAAEKTLAEPAGV